MEILLAIVGLSFLVIVHETGHYLAARAFGMRVLRYSIGFGPALFRYQPKGSPTVFQVCAIPFLAYVQIDGMNPAEEIDRSDPALFPNKGVLARMATIFAGPFANYLAASLIMFAFALTFGIAEPDFESPMTVSDLDSTGPAAQAGIALGDRIVEANGQPIANLEDLMAATRDRAGQPTTYIIERNGERLTPISVVPRAAEDDGRGIIGVVGPTRMLVPDSAMTAVVYSLKWPVVVTIDQVAGIAMMIQRRSTEGLQGPTEIVEHIAEQAARGAEYYVHRMALISVALGFFNLLPFPALDGGRLVFLAFELITRRRANEKVEAIVHTVGIIFLLGVIVMVTFRHAMS